MVWPLDNGFIKDYKFIETGRKQLYELPYTSVRITTYNLVCGPFETGSLSIGTQGE